MPIKPENRNRYPANWKEIRASILARTDEFYEARTVYLSAPASAQPADPQLLAEIRTLATSGMCHGLLADDYCSQIIAKLDEASAQPAEERCSGCDGTGDVHTPTGEWLGPCSCQVEEPVDEQPDRGAAHADLLNEVADVLTENNWRGDLVESLRALAAPSPASQPVAPTDKEISGAEMHDVVHQLREYASNPGYSHNDYADTMCQAANCIESLRAMFWNCAVAPSDAKGKADAAATPAQKENQQ